MENNMKIDIPIYISLTSIYKNQNNLLQTLKSIIIQTKQPNKIYLHLSEEEYILDSGFKDKKITNTKLLNFINNHPIIELVWIKNYGSFRKLLPLLKKKWNEDCIIITIDDDTIYDNNLIKNLVSDYNKHNCIIGYRGFTPEFNKIKDFDYNKRTKKKRKKYLYNFLTGKGGILYKPDFFYKTNDLIFNQELYLKYCSKQDDIWFYLVRVLNNIPCYLGNKNWKNKNLESYGLFLNFNKKNNNNTVVFRTIFKILEKNIGCNFISPKK